MNINEGVQDFKEPISSSFPSDEITEKSLHEPASEPPPFEEKKVKRPDCNERTQNAAHNRFTSQTTNPPSLDNYHFKTWFDVISVSEHKLYSRVVKAKQKALLRYLEIERENEYVIKCLEKLKSNFQALFLSIMLESKR